VDIGWKETDMGRLGLILGEKPAVTGKRIAEIGDENPSGQLFCRDTEQAGTDHNQ
jgi:hypothetical protein